MCPVLPLCLPTASAIRPCRFERFAVNGRIRTMVGWVMCGVARPRGRPGAWNFGSLVSSMIHCHVAEPGTRRVEWCQDQTSSGWIGHMFQPVSRKCLVLPCSRSEGTAPGEMERKRSAQWVPS